MGTRTNIVLTGMPGSGKSTIGVILAKELLMDFVDTDVLMQNNAGMALQDIYDSRGVEGFLEMEARCVTGLAVRNTVIAPGGSVVLNPAVMDTLRAAGTVVFLDVPIGVIIGRIELKSRGTVRKPGETLEDVWRFREPLYRRYADITIDCGDRDQGAVVGMIVDAFGF